MRLILVILLFLSFTQTTKASVIPSEGAEGANDCSNIVGKFKGKGEVLKYDNNQWLGNGEVSIVKGLLQGVYDKPVEHVSFDYKESKKSISIVYFGSHFVDVGEDGRWRPSKKKSITFSRPATCESGVVEMHYKRPWGGNGETATTKQEVKNLLFISETGDLIVKAKSKYWKKSWFGLFTEVTETIELYKFEPFINQ